MAARSINTWTNLSLLDLNLTGRADAIVQLFYKFLNMLFLLIDLRSRFLRCEECCFPTYYRARFILEARHMCKATYSVSQESVVVNSGIASVIHYTVEVNTLA